MPNTALRSDAPPSVGQDRPFGWRDKFGYLFGDLGNDFFFILTSSFLMVFYTDVFHISAATVGLLFVIARLWDAFADMAWGRFIDTRKAAIHGKFRPWILRMSLPLVVSGVLMFISIPGMSNGFYLAWAFVTYIAWGTLYSTVNIPYGSMASVITNDPVERTTLSTWRTMGAMLAGLVIGVLGPMIVFVDNKISADRMFMAAMVFGVLALCCYLACYKLSQERVVAPQITKEKVNLGSTIRGLVKNKPLISILAASLIMLVCTMLSGTVNTYLFKDYFGNTGALSMVGLVQIAATFLAIPLAKPLVARFGKKEIASMGMLIAALSYFIIFLLPDPSVTQYIMMSGIGMFGMGFMSIVSWAFVTDVIDYHEFLTELREDATVYALYSMARKVGQAIAGGIGGFAIAAVGYNAAIEKQTQETLHGIFSLGTLVPAIIYLVVFLILVFLYPLNKRRTNQLASDLSARRNKR